MTSREITDTIFKQISLATKMACGARDLVSGESCTFEGAAYQMPFLWFRVGDNRKLRKIIVAYNRSEDLYVVLFVNIHKKTFETTVLEEATGVYAEDLNETIYKMVNK